MTPKTDVKSIAMSNKHKNTEPWLPENRPADDGFKVPAGYFDTLEDRIFDRLNASGIRQEVPLKVLKKPAKRIRLPHFLIAAAAVITLLFGAVWFFSLTTTVNQSVASVELSDEDIEAYLLENVQDLELGQLALLPEVQANEYQAPPVQTVPSKKTESKYDITPEDVESILNDMTEQELEEIL